MEKSDGVRLQIKFHGVDPSDALTALIEERAQKLQRFCDRIINCRVFLEAPHHSQRHGHHYLCRIDLSLPGEELVVGRTPPGRALDEDAYRAVGHAFDVLERLLVEQQARRRQHPRPSLA
jgi:ribosomal subunit interface protein